MTHLLTTTVAGRQQDLREAVHELHTSFTNYKATGDPEHLSHCLAAAARIHADGYHPFLIKKGKCVGAVKTGLWEQYKEADPRVLGAKGAA